MNMNERKRNISKERRAEIVAWVKVNYEQSPSLTSAAEMFGVSKQLIRYYANRMGLKRIYSKADCCRYGIRKRFERLKTENGGEGYEALRTLRRNLRLQLFRSERLRENYGLPRKTKLRVSKRNARLSRHIYYLRKQGYIVDPENRIAYWTDSTKRGERAERDQRFFRFLPYGTQPEEEKSPKKPYVRPAYDGNINFNV